MEKEKINHVGCAGCMNTAAACTAKANGGCPAEDVSDDALFDLAELFKVFADSTRIRIIAALMGGELCVYHLSERLEMGQSAVSHQLRILRSAGLVRPRRDGKEVYYALDDEHVEEIFGAGLAHILHKGGYLHE